VVTCVDFWSLVVTAHWWSLLNIGHWWSLAGSPKHFVEGIGKKRAVTDTHRHMIAFGT
jgi:hypothetical protein